MLYFTCKNTIFVSQNIQLIRFQGILSVYNKFHAMHSVYWPCLIAFQTLLHVDSGNRHKHMDLLHDNALKLVVRSVIRFSSIYCEHEIDGKLICIECHVLINAIDTYLYGEYIIRVHLLEIIMCN